jgi:hypothetical protein
VIPFLNTLLKGRKAEGPVTEHRPVAVDASGRVLVNMSSSSPVEVGASAPTTVDGTILWLNTNAGEEGLYFFDQTRSKWLEAGLQSFVFGDDFANNEVMRTAVVNSAGVGTGHLVSQDITVVGIRAHARAGQADKGFEVRLNTSPIAGLAFNLVASNFSDMTLDVDVAGAVANVLDVFAVSAGGSAQDVTIDVLYRRRAS